VLTQLATARAGLVLVCINPAYRLHELDYALNKVGCRALVTANAFKSSNYAAMLMELMPELRHCAAGELRAAYVPALRSIVQIGARSLPGSFAFDAVMALGGENERTRLMGLAGGQAADGGAVGSTSVTGAVPCKRLPRMPGYTTTRGRHVSSRIDTRRVAFCGTENISAPNLS
jgi:hypothetical protein